MIEDLKEKPSWIDVKNKLPRHNQIVLAFSKITQHGKEGYGIAVFVDSVKMNEELWKKGYGNEAVDIKKHPFYFISQEQHRHTYKHVTHWMELPESPNEFK